MPIQVNEGTSLVIQIGFFDSAKEPVIPGSASWSLKDYKGNPVNGRDGVAISPLGTSALIVLSGADISLPVDMTAPSVVRYLTVRATYDSEEYGAGLTTSEEVAITITNLVGIPNG